MVEVVPGSRMHRNPISCQLFQEPLVDAGVLELKRREQNSTISCTVEVNDVVSRKIFYKSEPRSRLFLHK